MQSSKIQIPKGFGFANKAAVMAKLKRFAVAGKAKQHMVFDFDRTLTVNSAGTNEDITTWHILKKHFPAEGQARYQELFETYRPREIAGRMSNADAIEWWSQSLQLLVRYKVNMTEVEQDFLSKVSIRPGTKELFDLASVQGIPTVVLSAGIKDIIELWAQIYDVHPNLVLATKLLLNSKNTIIGWDKNTLVHALNKKEMGHAELARLRNNRPLAIVVGDGVTDADMVDGDESVLRILIYNPRPDEELNTNHIPAEFDLMIADGNFYPLEQLLLQLTS